jgi:hypothetical protein
MDAHAALAKFARCFSALACALACVAAHALSLVPLYVDELIDSSAVAFEGTCVANRTERDPQTNLPVTYTTFEVRDVLKGSVDRTHVIKQIGGALVEEGIEHRVPGIPRFNVGEDYVVFLAGVSDAGFSSPLGLAQGRFTIRHEGGRRLVSNGRDFKDMVDRIAARLPPAARARLEAIPGPAREMDIDDFKQTVREHARGAR